MIYTELLHRTQEVQSHSKCVTADVSKRDASQMSQNVTRHKYNKRVSGQICLRSGWVTGALAKLGDRMSLSFLVVWRGVRRRTRVVDNCPIYFTDTSLPCQRSSSLTSLLCMDSSTQCKKLISVQCSSLHWAAIGARQRGDSAMQRSAIDQG